MANHKLLKSLLIAGVWLISILSIEAQKLPERPNPPRLVNDFAKLLSQDELDKLERELVAYDDSSSTQIAIVTLESIHGYPAVEFAHDLLNKWGIGQARQDNGVLILVTTEPKNREVVIAVGYGLEPYITDALSKRIIETVIIPAFRNGDYYKGLSEASEMLKAYAKGEFKRNDKPKKSNIGYTIPSWVFLAMLLIVFVLFSINKGGKGGGKYYRTFGGPPVGGWRSFSSGTGTFKSGGSFGGGSFGGGGFGGFGGGRSGGGGASGRW
jgi:uncharacterized protein